MFGEAYILDFTDFFNLQKKAHFLFSTTKGSMIAFIIEIKLRVTDIYIYITHV